MCAVEGRGAESAALAAGAGAIEVAAAVQVVLETKCEVVPRIEGAAGMNARILGRAKETMGECMPFQIQGIIMMILFQGTKEIASFAHLEFLLLAETDIVARRLGIVRIQWSVMNITLPLQMTTVEFDIPRGSSECKSDLWAAL